MMMSYDRKLIFTSTLIVTFMILVVKETGAYYRGRHVCHSQKSENSSVPMTQTYKRPVYRKDLNKMTYVTAYRTVIRMRMVTRMIRQCCPGWQKRQYRDNNCLEPICTDECQNGGTCLAPDLCMCPIGYAGFMCQIDIDECSGRHQCQQTCSNTPGSYECGCRNGFQLTSDGRTCDLCLTCTEEFTGMQQQLDVMRNKIIDLEEEKEFLKSNLTSALSDYEAAISSFHEKEITTQQVHTSPAYLDDGYDVGSKDKMMPLRRLASLSEQISILEERMADCMCNGNGHDDYY